MTTLGQAALLYATRFQIPVFPLHDAEGGKCSCGKSCGSPGKHPRTVNGVRDASLDPAKIRAWWEMFPRANIGGSTAGLLVLDVDGHEGKETLQRFESEFGPLPKTPMSLTGGRGEHYFFCAPSSDLKNRVRFAPGLDTRSSGGYVVLPPSKHASGRQYFWEVEHRIDETPFATAPAWLLNLIVTDSSAAKKDQEHWRRIAREGAPQGERNHTTAGLAGHLLRRYVDPEVCLELLLAWNRERNSPPLLDAEVIKTINSVAGRELARRQSKEAHERSR